VNKTDVRENKSARGTSTFSVNGSNYVLRYTRSNGGIQ